jgi:uncharacterized ubiquitin-like protein YukD
MSNLTIEVWDATGNKKQLVELPADAPVNRVIAVLVDKMNLPRYSPDGQLMSYKFHHKASGRQLVDDQTLASADIHTGDVLRLQPEITAGLGADPWRPRVVLERRNGCAFCGESVGRVNGIIMTLNYFAPIMMGLIVVIDVANDRAPRF